MRGAHAHHLDSVHLHTVCARRVTETVLGTHKLRFILDIATHNFIDGATRIILRVPTANKSIGDYIA
ncbi:hypothetical protein LINGRAHAP2_LOCUS19183 [Linum grandiflorum]